MEHESTFRGAQKYILWGTKVHFVDVNICGPRLNNCLMPVPSGGSKRLKTVFAKKLKNVRELFANCSRTFFGFFANNFLWLAVSLYFSEGF